MGFSLSWLGVKGCEPDAILAKAGLSHTGEREEIPEAPFSAVLMSNGWYVIVAGHREAVVDDKVLSKLTAANVQAITCFVEEHVMSSAAAGWSGGARRWSVRHDAEAGIDHLEVEGEPPPELDVVLRFAEAEREGDDSNDVDYFFDVPIQLAKAITTFRHDQDVAAPGEAPFEVLSLARQENWFAQIRRAFG